MTNPKNVIAPAQGVAVTDEMVEQSLNVFWSYIHQREGMRAALEAAIPAPAQGVVEALQPFADYADHTKNVPRELVITKGSPYAKQQLTMGDCYDAKAALDPTPKHIG